MQKKLIALAVAGVLAAPIAASADSANVTIYGKMHYSWDFVDTNDVAGDSSDDSTGVTRASRLGFKGAEDLGNGMKAEFNIESQINGTVGSRNTYVGLSGNWGTVRMGRHDTPYKIATGSLDPFSDTLGDYNAVIGDYAGNNGFDERAPQTVAYISPSFNGFTAAIARVSGKANESAVAAADETEAWSMMGLYSNGPFFASLAYESYEDGANVLGTGYGGLATAGTNSGSDAWKLGLGYTFDFGGKIGFVYEDVDPEPAALRSQENWTVNYTHKFGNNAFKIAYGESDETTTGAAANGHDMWAVGIDHSFSKRTKAYALYATLDNDVASANTLNGGSGATFPSAAGAAAGRDVDGFSFGIVHDF